MMGIFKRVVSNRPLDALCVLLIEALSSSMPSQGAGADESAQASDHNLRSHGNFLQLG